METKTRNGWKSCLPQWTERTVLHLHHVATITHHLLWAIVTTYAAPHRHWHLSTFWIHFCFLEFWNWPWSNKSLDVLRQTSCYRCSVSFQLIGFKDWNERTLSRCENGTSWWNVPDNWADCVPQGFTLIYTKNSGCNSGTELRDFQNSGQT